MSTVNSSTFVPIFASQAVKIGLASTQGEIATFKKRIYWDTTKVALSSATLQWDVNQTYESGASIILFINDVQVSSLGWNAFETGHKLGDIDVTSALVDGDNSFKVQYSTAFGALTEQLATVTAGIQMIFTGQQTDNPVSTGNTQSADFWKNLSSNASLIGKIAIVGVIVLFSAWFVNKFVRYGGTFKFLKLPSDLLRR